MSAQITPAGTTPVGFLAPRPKEDKSEPAAFLADAVDPITGEYVSILQGYDPTDAFVLRQLSIVRGSGSAVLTDGRDFSDVTHVRPEHAQIFRQEILRPLRPVIEAREIRVVSILIEELGDAFVGYLTYENLALRQERTARLPLGGLH